MLGRILVVGLLLTFAAAARAAEPPPKPSPEENILRKAGVAVDDDSLLAFFRGRTLGDDEKTKIGDLVRRLGADDFDDRERAAKELRQVGGRAAPLVRAAADSPDTEIASRAKAFLKAVDPLPPLPAVAAARLVARRGPAGAVPVLLAYLPFADDGAVEDEARAALLALTPDGMADPSLAAALDKGQPVQRAAAAYVLGRKGDAEQREAVRRRLKDADASVRWQAAALLAAHDRAAVPCLVDLLVEGPFDPAWRAEEALRRLAGDAAPAPWLDDSAEGRRKCRDAWAAWWTDKGDKADLASYKEPERPLGYTLGVEYNTGRVWECDLDGSLRWEFRDLPGPMDAQVLPNGNVLIAEADSQRVTERDLHGKILWEQKIDGEPNGCHRLGDGNTFVSAATHVKEYAPDGAQIYSIQLQIGDGHANAALKGPDGSFYQVASHCIIKLDKKGKELGELLLPAGDVNYVGLQELPGGRFLLADSTNGRVIEVSGQGNLADYWGAEALERARDALTAPGARFFKGGKVVWQADLPGACGMIRLANGHTLASANHKVVEFGVDGKQLWEANAEGYVRGSTDVNSIFRQDNGL